MAATAETRVPLNRLTLAVTGGLAGIGLWLFVDKLNDLIENKHLYLFLFSATFGFFATFLAMAGPLSFRRAAIAALSVAGLAAALLTWASYRFENIENFLETVHPLVAFVLLLALPLPFLIAGQRSDEGWRCYPALFNHSWNIVVRYAAAWLFVTVFWGVVMLSVALFNVIGLSMLEDFLEIEYVPYVLTGVVLGLALAVVNELTDYVSPYLILRLLRLFLPVVLVVVAIFVFALPVNGMNGVLRGLSVASVLLAMALGAITLISTAVDRTDEEAVQSRSMRLMTQALALLLPVLSVLAIVAIWERVDQYGWTPDRLAAGSIAAVVFAYSIIYASVVIMRRNWMARIRSGNIYMALLVIFGAVLWLTPALNPQWISTRSQLARFTAGQIDALGLDIQTMAHDWGRAGKAGIERLRQISASGKHPALEVMLESLNDPANRRNALPQAADRWKKLRRQILQVMPVRPENEIDVLDVLEQLPGFELDRIMQGCRMKTRKGNPGCVLMHADLLPRLPGDEVVLWARGRPFYERVFVPADGLYRPAGKRLLSGPDLLDFQQQSDYIDAAISGQIGIEPVQLNGLRVKERFLIITP